MGNSSAKNNDDPNVIIKDAIVLKLFFAKYNNTPEKEELLEYIPIGVNYVKTSDNTAEPRSNAVSLFGTESYVQPYYPLSFQMTLHFSSGCKIKVSKEYNKKLIDFSKNTKTDAKIIEEYYENQAITKSTTSEKVE
jgi:hypothetical protein